MKKYIIGILFSVTFVISLFAFIISFENDKTFVEIKKEVYGRDNIYLSCFISSNIDYTSVNVVIKSDDYEESELITVVDNCFTVEFNNLTSHEEYDLIIYKDVNNEKFIDEFIVSPNLGSEDNPFLINSIEDFLSLNTYSNDYCILQQDLDFKDYESNPQIYSFNGVFDGNNFTLKNLNFDSYENIGIFNTLKEDSIIKNLNIDSATYVALRHSDLYIGSLASKNYGTIDNVNVSNVELISIGSSKGIQYFGGLVGINYETGAITNSSITNSIVNPSVSVSAYIGGFCGVNEGVINNSIVYDTNIVSTYNTNASIFDGNNLSNIYIGGFCGHNKALIDNCTTNSDIAFFVLGTKTGEKYNIEVTSEETKPSDLEFLGVVISDLCSLDEGDITNSSSNTKVIDIENALLDELDINISSNEFSELNITIEEETKYTINKDINYSLTYRVEVYDDLNSQFEYTFNKIK